MPVYTESISDVNADAGGADDIFGKPPSWLVTSGTTLFVGIIALFLLVCWMIKYPDTIAGKLEITEAGNSRGATAVMHIPQEYMARITIGQPVSVRLAAYPARQFGDVTGRLVSIADKLDPSDGSLIARIQLGDGIGPAPLRPIIYREGLKGVANIRIGETRLLARLFYFNQQ
jgi:hypothetical protein